MPTLKYLDQTYDCTTAIKGDDYIHLLDGDGVLVGCFEGITDFSKFTLNNGSYTSPTADHDCHLAIIRDDGTIGKGGHKCSDVFSKTGGELSGDVTVKKSTPKIAVYNPVSERSAYLTCTSDGFVYLRNEVDSTHRTGLLLNHHSASLDELLRVVYHNGGNAKPFNVVHTGNMGSLGVCTIGTGTYTGTGSNSVSITIPSGTKMLLIKGQVYSGISSDSAIVVDSGMLYSGQTVASVIRVDGVVPNSDARRYYSLVSVNFQGTKCTVSGASGDFDLDLKDCVYQWFAFT